MCKFGKSTNSPRKKKQIKTVTVDDPEIEEVDNNYQLVAIQNKPLTVEVKLDGKPLKMELDTGASVSLLSEVTYKSLFKDN